MNKKESRSLPMKKIAYLGMFTALTVSACGRDVPVVGHRAPPDETTVIDAPPLTVPPRFELRPPRDGSNSEELLREVKPQAVDPNDAWLIDQAGAVDTSIREKLAPAPLVEKMPKEEMEKPKKAKKDGWLKSWRSRGDDDGEK